MTDRMTDATPDPLDCAAAMRQLWDFLDGELTPDRMAAIRAHVLACRRCYPHHEFARAFLDALGEARGASAAPAELKRRVMERLEGEGFRVA